MPRLRNVHKKYGRDSGLASIFSCARALLVASTAAKRTARMFAPAIAALRSPDRSPRVCRRLRSRGTGGVDLTFATHLAASSDANVSVAPLATIVIAPMLPAFVPVMPVTVVIAVVPAAVAIRRVDDRPIGGIEAHFGPHALAVDQVRLAAALLQLDLSHREALRHEPGGKVARSRAIDRSVPRCRLGRGRAPASGWRWGNAFPGKELAARCDRHSKRDGGAVRDGSHGCRDVGARPTMP